MPTLLNIRLIQLKSELKNADPGIFLIFGLCWFLIYTSYTTYQKTLPAFYLTAFLYFICLSLQYYRKDKSFVYSHIHKPQFEIYLEYLALTFPFAISSLLTANWFCYPILIASLYSVTFLKYTLKTKTYFKHISTLISPSHFEWISGFRKSFLFLIPLYLLAIGFCWFRIFPLLILWLITVTVSSFYTECEPLQLLKANAVSSTKLLQEKMIQHAKYLVILYTPIIVINTILNTEYWLINLLFIPTQIAILCVAIGLKYANYRPNQHAIAANITLSLISLVSIMPYFLPIPILMAIDYYGKAKNNLNNYMYD
jgi:hypothetical protein